MKTQDNYIQLAKTMLTATHLTNNETGESIELNVNIKLIYAYMRDCYYQYTHTKYAKGFYCESNESIACNLGVSEVTVKRNLASLKQCGLVEVSGGTQSRRMVVKDVNETTWVYSNIKLADWKATAPERVIKSEAVKEVYKQKREFEKASEKPTVGFKMLVEPSIPTPIVKQVKEVTHTFDFDLDDDLPPF